MKKIFLGSVIVAGSIIALNDIHAEEMNNQAINNEVEELEDASFYQLMTATTDEDQYLTQGEAFPDMIFKSSENMKLLTLKLDKETQTISVEDIAENGRLHNSSEEYVSISLLDSNFIEKYTLYLVGNLELSQNVKLQDLKESGLSFEYGDMIQITQSQTNYFEISNSTTEYQRSNYYLITENGLIKL